MGLKLLISPTITVSGLLDFDGINDYVRFSSNPIPTGTQNLTFKLYIKEIPSSSEIIIHLNNGAVNDLISIFLDSSGDLVVSRSGLTHLGGLRTNISSKLNQILEIEVQKTTGSIDAVLINGVDNSNAAANYTPYNGTVSYVSCGVSNFLGSAFIWDINLSDNHSWAGYPEGNLDSAWVDTIGAIDCSVYGSPDTIDITGYGGTGPIQNVLSIVPSVETYTGVADFNNNSITMIVTGQGGSDDFRRGSNLKWKMWLDNDSGFSNDLFLLDNSSGNPTGHLKGWLFDSSLYLSIIGIAYNMYDISGLDNQILDCELTGGFGSYPEELKINNEVQSGTNLVPSGYSDHGGVYIGEAIITAFGVTLDNLDNATIWDIQAETSLGVPTHAWAGYPAGNTLGAWVDTVGEIDASIISTMGTRDIVGVNPGQGGETGSILLIDPPIIPVPGAPTLYRPLDTSTLETFDPSLAWLSVSGADTYWVQLDDDSGFGSLYTDVSGLTDLYYNVSGLDASTVYYWRAAATNTGGTGDWSEEWEFYTPQSTPVQTIFTLDSSFTYTTGGKTPLWGPTYYNNYMTQVFTPSDGGGAEQIRTLSIDESGVIAAESSIAYSYPSSQTVLDGILFVSKLFSTISSFYVNPASGEISKWKDNNSPVVSLGAQRLGSTQGKLIGSRGNSSDDIYVYSYTPDASGTLTRDSSLTFPTSYESIYNNKIISGENFVYLMRFSDPSVVTTNILTISGGVLTDTGYDVSLYTNYDVGDMWFEGFESSGNLYLSYNGLGIYHYSINQSTGEPTYVKKTTETDSVGIQSGIVGNKLINESNDQLLAGTGHLKSFDLDTFELDGSILRDGGNSDTGSGIITIDNSTFVTSKLIGQYTLDSFSLSFT